MYMYILLFYSLSFFQSHSYSLCDWFLQQTCVKRLFHPFFPIAKTLSRIDLSIHLVELLWFFFLTFYYKLVSSLHKNTHWPEECPKVDSWQIMYNATTIYKITNSCIVVLLVQAIFHISINRHRLLKLYFWICLQTEQEFPDLFF